MNPTDKLDVTLEAQHWESIMRVLSGGPYNVVAPLINEIQRQCAAQQQPHPVPTLVEPTAAE